MADQKKGTAAPLTKMEAVKQTLQELGPTTMPVAIKDHVKKRYGIDISADVASNYKKKLLKKAKAAADPQAAPPAVAAAQATSPAKKASAPLKKAAAPAKKPAAPAKKPAAPAKKPAAPAKKPAAPKPQASAVQPKKKAADDAQQGGSILLEDVLTVKDLLDRVGADKLRTLINGLAP